MSLFHVYNITLFPSELTSRLKFKNLYSIYLLSKECLSMIKKHEL